MSNHPCHEENKTDLKNQHARHSSCHASSDRFDYLLWLSLFFVVILYIHHAWFGQSSNFFQWYNILSLSVFELINTMWWGVSLGIFMLAILSRIPREFVMSVLGTDSGLKGILRATLAGLLLDLCNHGILMVGAKLYERGASIGQVMAFLIASPWNSFSLTLVLIALIGLKWTLGFVLLSMLIAIITGLIFEYLVLKSFLKANPQKINLPEGFEFWREAKKGLSETRFSLVFISEMLIEGIKESRMVVRWILFGVLLAGLVRALVAPEIFATYFGATLAGLGLTVLIATIMEVCSEGSTPVAADLLTRANAPGNSFAFLMTGVSTDYTEIMVLKETTRSWKIPLMLPLLTVPQVLLIAWLMNGLSA